MTEIVELFAGTGTFRMSLRRSYADAANELHSFNALHTNIEMIDDKHTPGLSSRSNALKLSTSTC
jgi:hypothetical protein